MNAPKAGMRGTYLSIDGYTVGFTVSSVDGNLCWSTYDNSPEITQPFIWRFKDGLNTRHEWPGKGAA